MHPWWRHISPWFGSQWASYPSKVATVGGPCCLPVPATCDDGGPAERAHPAMVASSTCGLDKGRGSTGSPCPVHGAPSCRRCLEQWQGVADCCRYGHEGYPRVGAPYSRGQYVSRVGMRKVAQTDRVAPARGMHRWPRRPWPEDDDENGAGANEQPLHKAAKAIQSETVVGDKRLVPWG